jgi:hypothetical protein
MSTLLQPALLGSGDRDEYLPTNHGFDEFYGKQAFVTQWLSSFKE